MAMAIKKMEKPTINMTEVPEDTVRRVDILFVIISKKKKIRRRQPSRKTTRRLNRLLLNHCTT